MTEYPVLKTLLTAALMTGLLLSALFGGFFLIWVHIAVIVGARAVFGALAGD